MADEHRPSGCKRRGQSPSPSSSPSFTPPLSRRRLVDSQSGSDSQPGLLAQLTANMRGPFSMVGTQYVVISTLDMSGWFKSIREHILLQLYPCSDIYEEGIISEGDWVQCCRYLTLARIHTVFGSVCGRRAEGYIPIASAFKLPKCLADVLNAIGVFKAYDIRYCPKPEDQPTDNEASIAATTSHEMLAKFCSLVCAAESRKFIMVSHLSYKASGTSWWMCSARDPSRISNIVSESDLVRVMAAFKEFTATDAALCAIVQRGNSGLVPGLFSALAWSTRDVNDALAQRLQFNLGA